MQLRLLFDGCLLQRRGRALSAKSAPQDPPDAGARGRIPMLDRAIQSRGMEASTSAQLALEERDAKNSDTGLPVASDTTRQRCVAKAVRGAAEHQVAAKMCSSRVSGCNSDTSAPQQRPRGEFLQPACWRLSASAGRCPGHAGPFPAPHRSFHRGGLDGGMTVAVLELRVFPASCAGRTIRERGLQTAAFMRLKLHRSPERAHCRRWSAA